MRSPRGSADVGGVWACGTGQLGAAGTGTVFPVSVRISWEGDGVSGKAPVPSTLACETKRS